MATRQEHKRTAARPALAKALVPKAVHFSANDSTPKIYARVEDDE